MMIPKKLKKCSLINKLISFYDFHLMSLVIDFRKKQDVSHTASHENPVSAPAIFSTALACASYMFLLQVIGLLNSVCHRNILYCDNSFKRSRQLKINLSITAVSYCVCVAVLGKTELILSQCLSLQRLLKNLRKLLGWGVTYVALSSHTTLY